FLTERPRVPHPEEPRARRMGSLSRRSGHSTSHPIIPSEGIPMRRSLVASSLVGAAALASIFAFRSAPAKPGDNQPRVAEPTAKAAGPALPVSQVALFSSGVGYFQR